MIAGALVCLLAGGGIGLWRVGALADAERDHPGEWQRSGDLDVITHRQLVVAHVAEGSEVLFELCSTDGLPAEGWGGVSFDVWFVGTDPPDLVSEIAYDDELAPRIQRNERAACVVFAQGHGLPIEGEYAIGYRGEGPDDAELRGRVMAWLPIGPTERAAVYLLLLGALLGLFALAMPRPRSAYEAMVDEGEDARPSWLARLRARPAWQRVTIGVGCLFGAMFLLALVPIGGAAMGLARGLAIAAVEVAVAWLLVDRPKREAADSDAGSDSDADADSDSDADADSDPDPDPEPEKPEDPDPDRPGDPRLGLALVRPRGGLWLLGVAPVLGAVLWIGGRIVMNFVPSTSVSPIEAFVSFPSGGLAVGCVAVCVPVAEELFFRGFLFGALERAHGRALATVLTIVLFAVVHLPQQWGAWGAFASVAATGAGLTLLRLVTRSTLVPAVAHLAHNGFITLLAL